MYVKHLCVLLFVVRSPPRLMHAQVDVLAWRSKTSRVHAQIKDFCAILSGLVVAQDYKRGQQLIADKDFDENADFFQVCWQVKRPADVTILERQEGR